MESKDITVNGIKITAHSDGSITKPYHRKAKTIFGANSHGYRLGSVGDKMLRMHRVIAKAFLSDYSEDLQVDHINGNKADNRPHNLRMVTQRQNLQAHRTKQAGTSSVYRGVCWYKRHGKWMANIGIDGKNKNLGYFTSEREAAIAYDACAHSQGFAIEALNFPEHFTA